MYSLDVQRILKAREIVCPSIILTFHHGDKTSYGCLVIDYIENKYEYRSKVIRDYLEHGNDSGTVRGYGNITNEDLNVDDLVVKYYWDVTSYLYDPEKCAPVITTPSCYKNVDPRTNTGLKEILEKFISYLETFEKECTRMEDIEAPPVYAELFTRDEFTKPSEVGNILSSNEQLSNFSELIKDSEYFNSNLF